MKLQIVVLLLSCSFLVSCATVPLGELPRDIDYTNTDCADLYQSVQLKKRVKTLNTVTTLFQKQCYVEAIELGKLVRDIYGDKYYSVSQEALSIFVPEDKIIDYTLESHERTYISFLISASYLKKGKQESSEVELRRGRNELSAILYNYGNDPVNLGLMAGLWNNLDQDISRPYWKKLSQDAAAAEVVQEFSKKQMKVLDRGGKSKSFRIYGIGNFPKLDWDMQLTSRKGGSYYEISSIEKFPADCSSETGMVITTESWLNKLKVRYHHDYHPLLNVKSWARLPIGILYASTAIVGGVGLGAVGCYIDAAGDGNGDLCGMAIQQGAKIVSYTDDIARYAFKPDIRHWSNVPMAFLITTAEELSDEKCYKPTINYPIALEFF